MKTSIIIVGLVCALVIALPVPTGAAKARPEEALSMARSWVRMVIVKDGKWAGSAVAEVTGVQEIARKGRVLGYFCPVSPKGYVVVSLYKELAAVKAWSDTSNLDPGQDDGPADLIKGGFERMIKAVEKKSGKKIDTVNDKEFAEALEINYRSVWDKPLTDGSGQSGSKTVLGGNYQGGTALLTSSWHQRWPYNAQCPALGCSEPSLNGHAFVGCVATAGAQILKYWCCPLDGYAWTLIPDDLQSSSPQNQIDETARLCHEVGLRVGMNYGCDGSTAYTENMVGVFDDYGYAYFVNRQNRSDYDATQWWELIGTQHNVNRPVQYRVDKHSIVCDGHRIDAGVLQLHMNYGWDDTFTTWYTVDALHLGDPPNEFIVTDIVPSGTLMGVMSGTYPGDLFPVYSRYFDRDTSGSSALFNPGMRLQFLPNITAACTGTTGQSIRFTGTSANVTRMFTRGDVTRGVVIRGEFKLKPSGTIVLR